MNETYANPRNENYATNKVDVYHIDDTWSTKFLDLNDFVSKNKSYRCFLVLIDRSSEFGWTIPEKLVKMVKYSKTFMQTSLKPQKD